MDLYYKIPNDVKVTLKNDMKQSKIKKIYASLGLIFLFWPPIALLDVILIRTVYLLLATVQFFIAFFIVSVVTDVTLHILHTLTDKSIVYFNGLSRKRKKYKYIQYILMAK